MFEQNELARKFFAFDFLLKKYFAKETKKVGGHGSPHRGQGRVLTLLTMQSNISQKDLAYILGMRPQSVGELLGKLEKNEWITRTPSDEDKRVMLISLTEEGREKAKQLAEEPKIGEDLFGIFSEEEQEQFAAYIDRLTEEVAKRVGEDPTEHPDFMERFNNPEFFGGGHPHPHPHHGPGHHPHPHGPHEPGHPHPHHEHDKHTPDDSNEGPVNEKEDLDENE